VSLVTSISKQDALVALAAEGLIAVEHPDGSVQAPGGGETSWPAIAAIFLCGRPTDAQMYRIAAKVAAWNQVVGTFTAASWEPTRVSIMDRASGHVIASCELNDEDALIDALLTVVFRRHRQ
jgi:hypothetical protein